VELGEGEESLFAAVPELNGHRSARRARGNYPLSNLDVFRIEHWD
jgi:hypothetical protein